jgi:hypothetical protein
MSFAGRGRAKSSCVHLDSSSLKKFDRLSPLARMISLLKQGGSCLKFTHAPHLVNFSEKFARGADNQSFLVEAVSGVEAVK